MISFSGFSQGGYFLQNTGQLPDNVIFTSRLNYGNIFIEKDGKITVKVFDPEQFDEFFHHDHDHSDEEEEDHSHKKSQNNKSFSSGNKENLLQTHTFHINFLGADFNTSFSSKNFGEFKVNILHGNDPSKWATDLIPYSEIELENIYPGINIKFYFVDNSLKYDYILSPGADLNNLKIQYEHLNNVIISDTKVILDASTGIITDEEPYSYLKNSPQQKINTTFRKINSNTVQLITGLEKVTQKLIVDPKVNFSTYTGSTLDNWGYTATYDNSGNGYAGGIARGHTPGTYPITTGAAQEVYGGGQIDMTISKFSPDGENLIYSTYIGGAGLEAPHSMVVNNNNELIIYGVTSSADYPTSATGFDRTFNGGTYVKTSNIFEFNDGTDIVITKLSSSGNAILGSTYYGGTANDAMNDSYKTNGLAHNYADDYRGEVTVNDAGEIFISSVTSSADLPVANSFQLTYGGGSQDGCVTKFNSDLSSMIWGSFLGGPGDDACYASKQNSSGETYVTGGTTTIDFASFGFSNVNSGGIDGFLARISADGSSILDGRFVGTSNYDQSYFVEVDHEDKIYCFGQSLGAMPITAGAYNNPNSGQFLQKYSADLSTIEAATVFGSGDGVVNIVPSAFMVSNCKEVYLSGWGGVSTGDKTFGTRNMPITGDAFQSTTDGSDFYFMLLGPDFDELKFGTYYGGSGLGEHNDGGTSRFDRSGTIYQSVCAGCGGSSAFPTTPGVHSTTNDSYNCNLALIKSDISKFSANIKFTKDSVHCENEPVTFENQSTGGTRYEWIFPDGTSSNDYDAVYFFPDTGRYTVSLIAIDSTQCPFADTSDVVVNIIKVPEVDIDIDTFLCKDNSLTINTVGGPIDTNYTWWNDDSTFTLIKGPDLTVTPDSTTTYFVRYTNMCGSTTSSVNVPVYYPPESSSEFDTICEGEQFSSYFYYDEDYDVTELNGKSFTLDRDSIFFPTGISDIYYINTEGSCGEAIDTFEIEFVEIDAVSGPDTIVCAGEEIDVFAKGAENYKWDETEFPDNFTDSILTVNLTETKTYYPELSIGRCSEIDTIEVKVFPKPFQPHDEEYIINFKDEINVSLNPSFSYSWTPRTYLDCADCFEINASPEEDITYYFSYSDDKSCRITDSIQVKVIFPIYIPNTFTPDNDGINDVFYAYSEILDDYELTIFNRWGELIFRTTDLDIGWDGTFNGHPQQIGVYVYELKYVFRHTNQQRQQVGLVNLLR